MRKTEHKFVDHCFAKGKFNFLLFSRCAENLGSITRKILKENANCKHFSLSRFSSIFLNEFVHFSRIFLISTKRRIAVEKLIPVVELNWTDPRHDWGTKENPIKLTPKKFLYSKIENNWKEYEKLKIELKKFQMYLEQFSSTNDRKFSKHFNSLKRNFDRISWWRFFERFF